MASYYVANSGNNGNNGLSSGAPFETISHAISVWSAGDEILLKRGDVFDPVSISGADGSSGSRYRFGAYGSGSRPKISGFVNPGSSWVSEGSNIYSYYNAGFEQVRLVRIGGTNQPIGRFPKSGYWTIQNRTGNTQISDSTNLGSAPNFVGGELVTRKVNWVTDVCQVTAQTSSSVTMISPSGYELYINNGYFFQNHINCLTQQNDWYYNASEKKVYMYSTTNPDGLSIEISFAQRCMYFSGCDYYDIDDLDLQGSYEHGLQGIGSNHVRINRTKIRNHGYNGLHLSGCSNLLFDRSEVSNVYNNGIDLRDASQNGQIIRSKIENIAMVQGMMGSSDHQGMGIHMHANAHNTLIEKNLIRNIGYAGVYFRGNNTIVRYNIGLDTCMVKADGGAFYHFGNYSNPTTGIICEKNIALGCIGNGEGLRYTDWNGDSAGYYADDNSKLFSIRNNYAENCAYGLYGHNCWEAEFKDNICYDNVRFQARWGDDDAQGSGTTRRIRSMVITGNKLIAKAGQYIHASRTIGSFSDPWDYGLMDNNFFDFENTNSFQTHLPPSGAEDINLATWRSRTGHDQNSELFNYDPSKTVVLYNDTEEDQDFNLTKEYEDWDGVAHTIGTITLEPYESILLFETGELNVAPPTFDPNFERLINCGGPGDSDFTNSAVYTVEYPITNAGDIEVVYQTERFGNFKYSFPLANEVYKVKLHFAEIYHGTVDAPNNGVGDRVMDIYLNGELYRENFDVFAEVGELAALVLETSSQVVNDTFEVEFVGKAGDAKISAIEVWYDDGTLPAPTYSVTVTPNDPARGTAMVTPSTPQVANTEFTLQANAANGFVFSRYHIGGETFSLENPHSFFNPGFVYEIEVEFVVAPPEPKALTLEASNPAWGTVTDLTNAGPYLPGVMVSLKAEAGEDYYFEKWTRKGVTVSTVAEFDYEMPEDITNLVAVFLEKKNLSLAVFPLGSGSFSGAGKYAPGEKAAVEAINATGWTFSYWMRNGQVVSNVSAFDYSMGPSDTELVAFFEATSPTGTSGAYSLNGINIEDYGIIPSQAPDSNIALWGAWDMPKRTGKTFHDWGDVNGPEPYVRADEIFFSGRDLRFYGLLQADTYDEAMDKVLDFYESIDDNLNLITFGSPYGIFNVQIQEEIQASHITDGWWQVIIPMREPVPNLTGDIPVGESTDPGIDGNAYPSLSLLPLRREIMLPRAAQKRAGFTAYGQEGHSRTKNGMREYAISYLLSEATYTGFNNRIKTLLAMFSSPGLRTLRLGDGTYREVFVKDGFSCREVQVIPGQVSGVLEVMFAEVKFLKNWNILIDNEGNLLTDNEGRSIFENLD